MAPGCGGRSRRLPPRRRPAGLPAPLSSSWVAFRRPSSCSRLKTRASVKASAGHFQHLLEDRSSKKPQDCAGSFLVLSRKSCRVFCGNRKSSSRAPPFYSTHFGVRPSHHKAEGHLPARRLCPSSLHSEGWTSPPRSLHSFSEARLTEIPK